MIPEQKGCYHDNDDYRYNLDRLDDLNLPVGLAETVGLQAERVACLILQHYLTRKPGGWGFTEDIPTLAKKLEQRLGGTFGELEAFRNEFAPGHGTAFLVTRQLVFTAAHCICYDNSSEVNPKLVNTTRVVFGFHGVKEKRSDYFFSEDQVRTATVVASQHFRARGKKTFYSEWSDWALLKLDKEVPWKPLPLNFEKVMNKIELYMLGHPNGLSLKLTYNGMLEGNTEHDFFECKIDAFQGNSGSPIFNATTYRVEGILIEGRKDYEVLDNKIQARQITASKITSNPIGYRMENCQRLSSLHHLVDKDLLDSKDLETVQNAPEIIVHSLKELYKSRNTIHRLLEQPLHIDTIYTELVLLSEPKEKEKQDKKTFEEGRINSWEDIQGEKQSIALHTLFENRNDKIPKRLLILGRAGIGKSTLCQYIANQWAEGKLWQEKFEAVFWIPLRKLQNVHSAEMAASALFRLCCPVQELFTKDIAQYLEKNREKVLLVLDGLDEITLAEDSQQKKILDQLLNFPYWIVTSRPHAAGSIHADETIENVGYASKTIDLYIQKSFPDNAATVIQKLRQNPILFGFCHIPINLELICTILKKSKGDLSKINSMTSLYEELTFTLQKRFLEKIGKPYIWDWTPKKLEHNNEIQNDLAIFKLLEAIAWMGMQDRLLIFSLNSEKMKKIIEEFPDINLENVYISGFLQSTQDSDNVLENEYSFLHLTLQEFFAARYLAELLQKNPKEAAKCIREVKFDPRYKVLMWFVAGLLKNEGGEWPGLNAFFDCLSTPKDLIGLYGALLKVRCLEECGWQKEVQKRKAYEEEIQVWVNWAGRTLSENGYISRSLSETFQISSQGAKLLLIPKFISIMSKKSISIMSNKSRDRRRKATNVLGKIGQADPKIVIPALLLALKDEEVGHYAVEALWKIGQVDPLAVIPTLLEALQDENGWWVSKTAADALGEVGQADPLTVIPPLLLALKHQDEYAREGAAKALQKIGQIAPLDVIPALLLALENKDRRVRSAAAKALGEAGRADPLIVIPSLLLVLKDEDWLVKKTAVEALVQLGQADILTVIPVLLEALKGKDECIRSGVVKALGQIAQTDKLTVVPALLLALEDTNDKVREAAAEALGQVSQADILTVIPALLLALKDEAKCVRSAAAKALGKIGLIDPLAVIPTLLLTLNDKDAWVKKIAAEALGEVGHADPLKVIAALLLVLKDRWSYNGEWARETAAEALGKIGHADPLTAIPALCRAVLEDAEESVRSAAAEALGKVGLADTPMVIPVLLLALKDKDIRQNVYGHAVKVLSKIGQIDPLAVIPGLCLALEEKNVNVRTEAAKILGLIGHADPQTVIPALLKALKNEFHFTREKVIEALGKIGHADPLLVTPKLLPMLKDEIGTVRSTAAYALELIHDDSQKVLPTLLKIFANGNNSFLIDTFSKYDLTPYLKSNPYILTSDVSPGILSSTPLFALVSCYKEDAFYASAIVKKCMEENLPLFQEGNNLCFYEQGNLCKINFPKVDQFRIQIENRIAEYPDFTKTCSIQ